MPQIKPMQTKLITMLGRGILASLAVAAYGVEAQTDTQPPIVHPPASVPYRWVSVVIRGGGFISGLLFSTSQKGLVCARTDVGVAYRSIDAGAPWTALLDGLGPSESSYLGIESMAVDPSDANKLYPAAGMYSAAWGGPSAIARSSDQGRTLRIDDADHQFGWKNDLTGDPRVDGRVHLATAGRGIAQAEPVANGRPTP